METSYECVFDGKEDRSAVGAYLSAARCSVLSRRSARACRMYLVIVFWLSGSRAYFAVSDHIVRPQHVVSRKAEGCALLGASVPGDSGKTTAMRILALLCRRSLPTTDISSAGLYDVCHRMSPTLLIDETRTAGDLRKLLHLLRSSSARGFVALRKDKARMAFVPKILSWVELPNDPMLNSRCVIVPRVSTRVADTCPSLSHSHSS
jgi:hypothetical protein